MRLVGKEINFQKKLTIIPIGDVHLGSKASDLKHLNRTIKRILDTPDCYTIMMGDICDLITLNDKRRFDPEEQVFRSLSGIAQQQRDLAIKTFQPLADRGLILGYADGNHEEYYKKHAEFDVSKDIVNTFNGKKKEEDKGYIHYLGYCFFYNLILSKGKNNAIKTLTIWGHHGKGGGTVGGSVNKITQQPQNFIADIFLMGHDHNKFNIPRTQIGVTQCLKPSMYEKHIRLVRTGSFLKSYQQDATTYSERALYAPSELASPVIEIDIRHSGSSPHTFEIKVTD